MRTLVVTAVPQERDAVLRGVELGDLGDEHHTPEVVAAGVGPAAAAAATARALVLAETARRPYGLVISAGICGGFAPLTEGPVVASSIRAADLGAQAPDAVGGFASVTDLGFGTSTHPVPTPLAKAVARAVDAAFGPLLTVSTATGTTVRAAELAERHPGAVGEAMEGFGVAEAASAAGLPVLEVRTISNSVGPRERSAWRVPEALGELSEVFQKATPLLERGRRR